MSARRDKQVVRYVSPFGSPAWMPRERAEELLRVDDARWCTYAEIQAETGYDIRSDYMREVGGPRIEVPR